MEVRHRDGIVNKTVLVLRELTIQFFFPYRKKQLKDVMKKGYTGISRIKKEHGCLQSQYSGTQKEDLWGCW
jgi:hypothetical protein